VGVTGALPQCVIVGRGSEPGVSGQIWQKLISIRSMRSSSFGRFAELFSHPVRRCSKPGSCANFESATIRDKMNGMVASPFVEAAMCAGL
jgi:hypothetical protein